MINANAASRIGYLVSWNPSSEDVTHIPYSHWPKIIPSMSIEWVHFCCAAITPTDHNDCRNGSSIMTTIVMDIKGRFFNPSRASPLAVAVRSGYRGRREVFVGKQPAVAVITGYCSESNVIHGRLNKSISVLFHGQEWERYSCFVTMIFDEQEMIAQLNRSVMSFSTLPESIPAPPVFPNSSLSPLSGRRKIADTPVERSRGALYFSDVGELVQFIVAGP